MFLAMYYYNIFKLEADVSVRIFKLEADVSVRRPSSEPQMLFTVGMFVEYEVWINV